MRFSIKSAFILSGILLQPVAGIAQGVQRDFSRVSCAPIAEPAANGPEPFMISLNRKSQDPRHANYKLFDVTVSRLVPPHNHFYEKIGNYIAIGRVSPETFEPMMMQFSTPRLAFSLRIYRAKSVPSADLWMITNAGSQPGQKIVMQLKCSIGK